MTESTLTARQREILEMIEQHMRDRGYPPSVREIGEAVGLTSPSTVHAHLGALQKRGYPMRASLGSLAAGGTLGILIPPSVNMIVYGSLTNNSIGKLFIATILPGILVAIAFSLLNIGLALLFPRFVGTPPMSPSLARSAIDAC